MKSVLAIVWAFALFACQDSHIASPTEDLVTLEFRGLASADEMGSKAFEFEGKTLLLSKPRRFEVKVFESVDALDLPAIRFTIADNQNEEFGDFTESLIHQPLAILVDGKIINLPTVIGRLNNGGLIEGGRRGFTSEGITKLITSIESGSQ